MADTSLIVADGMMVSLDFTLRLDDGQIIATSEGQDPLVFLQGQGQIMPGLEQAIHGMAIGDERDVVVAPADGYGEENPDALQLVPHDAFPPEVELTLGMGLRMRDELGQVFKAYVAGIRPDGVLLDFNHPLAGETLYFHVKVASLRPATREELSEPPEWSEE